MMKKYIFYTTDGFTQDLQLNETENCQLLGTGEGINVTKAYEDLFIKNMYIKKHAYKNIMAYEIIGNIINV